jgi:hypothetical protein
MRSDANVSPSPPARPVTAAFLGIVIAALSSMITTGVIAALVAWKVCK